jgi:signal transduction histidine kinase
LSVLIKEVVEELRVLAQEKNQTLTTSIEMKMEAMVDKETLRLAISNILHNAIRYTQEGGMVEVQTAKIERNEVVIDIIDNGPGIPETERTKVFERFYRVDKARSKAAGGVGLGLAIARWAVEVNGGTIAFYANNEPGTRCRIILPFA